MSLDLTASRIITVGGTNGKGSTVTMLSDILQATGHSVATYTSPHLLVYNERVCLNGLKSDDADLCMAFHAVEQARGDITLTYFEFGTLAALKLFAQWRPGFIILEVGLGGRLDAVNIVDSEISILTNVALDHMDWLGNTREDIAYEKSGIFRPGRPAIYGERDMPHIVQQKADEMGAGLYCCGREFDWTLDGATWQWRGLDKAGNEARLGDLPLNDFPVANAACALQALYLLEVVPDPAFLRNALQNAILPGRFQAVTWQGRQLILDVAHNPHAAVNLATNIRNRIPGGKARIVLGMLNDKDSRSVVEILAPVVSRLYAVTLGGERGAPAEIIYNYALEAGLPGVSRHESVMDALEAALAQSAPAETVIITGSFFMVAAVLELI
jgi:dihydrofolate synthase/folylpolyglutamate synthase